MFQVLSKSNAVGQVQPPEVDACDCYSYFLSPPRKDIRSHVLLHTAPLFTLISGLFFPSPLYFLLLFQVSSFSFLPPHPLNPTTHWNPEFCSSVVFQNEHFPPCPFRSTSARLTPPWGPLARLSSALALQPLLTPAEVHTISCASTSLSITQYCFGGGSQESPKVNS